MKYIMMILLSVSFTAIGQIVLKVGVRHLRKRNFDLALLKDFINPLVVTGLVIYSISAVLWLYVLSKVDITYAYPFLSFGFILVLIFGYFFLGEIIDVYKVCGILLIISGLVVLSFSR